MVTYTSSPSYWAPLRPRIRIYEFEDKTYADPLYEYNAFTDVGTETKPIALSFDSGITSVGDFGIEIEDGANAIDADIYMRGNRVVIECSKDGITWEPAFKGLVRSSTQKLYASTGRNIILEGYSYLVRLNERILNVIKESSLTGSAEDAEYNRSDATMFTNNLINDLLTTDSNYVYTVDDTQLYDVFQTSNILSSPITEWIPRLDAQLVTLNSAIDRVLEFSNGLVMLNPADDELMLYTADLITPATGIFTVTNYRNENADDSDITMYPLEAYTYNVSYDYPDSGSRLIGSIGSGNECPPDVPPEVVGSKGRTVPFFSGGNARWLAPVVQFPSNTIRNLSISVSTVGNNSFSTTMKVRIYTNSDPDGGYGNPGTQVGSDFNIYVNGNPNDHFPTTATDTVVLSQNSQSIAPTVSAGKWYFLAVKMIDAQSSGVYVSWKTESPIEADHTVSRYGYSTTDGASWTVPALYLPGDQNASQPTWVYHKWLWSVGGGNCGGSQPNIEKDPVFLVAHDRNMSGRLGVVERVVSDIPTDIKTKQTLNEYLFNKLYFSAKPRFTFDFPSVSMPDKVPKAGDIVTHVDTRVGVGLQNAPIQTGVINRIRYRFDQGSGGNDAMGLRKLALSTTGIKRGSY